MANNTFDIESYPMYNLDKRGQVIQQILTVADTIFGMAPSYNEEYEEVGFQSTVKGAENLVNSENCKATFTNDFTIDKQPEAIYDSLCIKPISQYVALANYASEASIKALFNKDLPTDESGNYIEPVQLAAPVLMIDSSNNKVKIIDGTSSAIILDKHYFTVNTYTEDNLDIQYSFQADLTLPTLDESLCAQEISVVAPGDSIFTLDSEPSLLYQICMGKAISTCNSSFECNIMPLADISDLGYPKLLPSKDLIHKLAYRVTSYDYSSNTVTTGDVTYVEDEDVQISLALGEKVDISIETEFETTFADPTYVPMFNSSNTLVVPTTTTYSNFKTLTRPSISYNKATNTIIFTHSQTDPSAAMSVDKTFIFNVRRKTDESWENIPAYLVVAADAGFLADADSVSINLDTLNITAGDTIRVKSIAEYFNDSAYSYYTFTDSTEEATFAVPTVDLAASKIIEATFVDMNDANIKTLWNKPSSKI